MTFYLEDFFYSDFFSSFFYYILVLVDRPSTSDLSVFYFYSFSSWILIVLEKSSLILAFMKGIYRIFLIEGLLLGSLINISERSFFNSGL